jgi:RNA polymerase sigma factor (sigma-70 family)
MWNILARLASSATEKRNGHERTQIIQLSFSCRFVSLRGHSSLWIFSVRFGRDRTLTAESGIEFMNERELLTRFATDGCDRSFEQLVRQNVDMIFSAARRQVGGCELAEDVTQAVFVLLARKAGKIRGPLAGWLILTTHFCAANAKKLAARREFHERRAGEMKLAESGAREQSEWDSYAPMLDGAMARLGEKDRNAVAMRHLQNVSFKEIGVALGISEEAARKRVDRATDRLRRILSGKTVVPAAMVTQLAERGSAAAPSEMVARIVTSGGSVAKGTMAGAIAQKAAGAMLMVKVKIAAILLVFLGVAGTGIVASIVGGASLKQPVLQTQITVTPAAASIAAPVVFMSEESEAQATGMVQLVQWDLILNDAGATAVSSVGQAVGSGSKVYQAMRCEGAELRHAVAGAMGNGEVVRTSKQVSLVDLGSSLGEQSSQLEFQYQPEDGKPFFFALATSRSHEDKFDRIGAERVHVKLNHPDLNFGVQDVADSNMRRTRGGNGIVFEGELAAGDAVAFLAKVPGSSGTAYYHLVVWETFKALPAQMSAMDVPHDSGWWCEHGPGPLRQWADVERIWAANAPVGRIWGPPGIERKLDDGRSVWLWGFCRPEKWPFCWWDPVGNPASAWTGAIWMGNELPQGLWAQVGVTTPQALEQKIQKDNGGDMDNPGPQVAKIPDGATQIEVGIPLGPWKEIGRLKFGESVEVDGVRYQMDARMNSNNWIDLTVSGVVNDQIQVEPMNQDGKESGERVDDGGAIKWRQDLSARVLKISVPALGNGGKKNGSFKVTERKRQFVSFSGFATQPTVAPKSDLSAEAIRDEVAKLRQEDMQKYLDALASHRGFVFAFFGNDATQWRGAMQKLLHAAAIGDEKTVRDSLMADDPQIVKLLDEIAHLIVLGEAIRTQSVQRFGERATHAVLDRPELFEDLEAELASCGWSQVIDRQSPTGSDMQIWDDRVEPIVWRRQADGTYRLSVDSLAERGNLADELALKIKVGDEINRGLSHRMTLEEMKVAVGALKPVEATSGP